MNLKDKMRAGDFCVGPFLKTGSSAIIEVTGHAGLDFVILDMEHGPLSYEALEHHVLAADHVGLAPIVRVEAITEHSIIRPLDKGAAGLVVPHVDSAEMAQSVIRFSRFGPQGQRGMDIYARAAQFGHMPKQEYLKKANETTLLALQIEGAEGIRNLDEILAVPGSDVIFVGPYDLSQSLGVPGEINHPEVISAVERIVEKVRSADRHVGIYADDVETARKWIRLGVQFVALSVDTAIYYQACKRLVASLREPAP
ncbi:MAG: aldolase [Phycisphaerae bacterium]|nr:aldolase [Phycisphaerae bacterium]